MDIEDLKAAWQEMSDRVTAQKQLTDKLILSTIQRKSMDVIEEMRSGLACGMLGSSVAIVLPLIWALRSGDGMVGVGALVILALALVNMSVAWRVYRALDDRPVAVWNVRETVQTKLQRIHAFYSWSRSYGLLLSVLIYFTGIVTYLTFRYGYVRVTTTDVVVYIGLACAILVLTLVFNRRHEIGVAGRLERCLEELESMDPGAASPFRSPDLLGPLFAACVIALSVAIVLLTWNQAAR